eukprot:2942093-Rhodomonas_salina.2
MHLEYEQVCRPIQSLFTAFCTRKARIPFDLPEQPVLPLQCAFSALCTRTARFSRCAVACSALSRLDPNMPCPLLHILSNCP